MEKLNTYSYMGHFYKTGGPFYDNLLLKTETRKVEGLPLDGIYKFRLFDSRMQIDEIYQIIKGINDLEILRRIRGIVNLSNWYYIGDELSDEKKAEFVQFCEAFGNVRRIKNAQRIIDPKIDGISPIPLDNLENVAEIYPSSCRRKSLVLLEDINLENKRYL